MVRVLIAAIIVVAASADGAAGKDYDIAINNGRVIDPETGLDDIRHVGVKDGAIATISKRPLAGAQTIDAQGLVVAPGFIDRNTYVLGPELFRLRAADGVTTTFNFEEGANDVPAAYDALKDQALINFGFSSSWAGARLATLSKTPPAMNKGIAELGDIGPDEMAAIAKSSVTDEQLAAIIAIVEQGLKDGAPAVGMGVEYMPGATMTEVLEVFKLAAKYNRSVQIHLRDWDRTSDYAYIYEPIAGALLSGAAIHISHLNSSAANYVERNLDQLDIARQAGVAVTTECYPYTAGMNDIRAEMWADWREWPEERFHNYQWSQTGERLTKDNFAEYREKGGLVIIHWMKEEWIDACVAHPETQIASDGGWDPNGGHPRDAGTNTSVLGRFVREKGLLSLPAAIRKMSYLPATSLEAAAPQMARKGRLQKGMDADIVIFNAGTVSDRATYAEPQLAPEGIDYVIVNGVVIKTPDGFVDGAAPGEPIRLPPAE
ncbi:amidohydrolase family protein [Hyphococcus sp.]|uniref:amidohydrolase family protein n=1 Tax=Hyphococcus sp. TaxID=2038636 RepID=UPI003D111AA9